MSLTLYEFYETVNILGIYHEVEPIVEVYETHPFPHGMDNPDGSHFLSLNSQIRRKMMIKRAGKIPGFEYLGLKKVHLSNTFVEFYYRLLHVMVWWNGTLVACVR